MHAADNFSPCSIEGQLLLEPTIMDKIPLGHSVQYTFLRHAHYFSLHFPQETLNLGGGEGCKKIRNVRLVS